MSPEYLDVKVTNQKTSDDLNNILNDDSSDWQLVQRQRDNVTNLRDLNSNIMLVCLLLECVGVLSQVRIEEDRGMGRIREDRKKRDIDPARFRFSINVLMLKFLMLN